MKPFSATETGVMIVCAFIAGILAGITDWPPYEDPVAVAEVQQITPEQAEILHDKLDHIINEQLLQDREESANERLAIQNQIGLVELRKLVSLLEARIIHLEK